MVETPGFSSHLRIWSHITETTIFSRGCFGYYQVHIFIKRSQWYLEEFPSYQGRQVSCIWICFTRSFTWIRSDIESHFFWGVIVSSKFSPISPWLFVVPFPNEKLVQQKPIRIFWVPKLRFQNTTSAKRLRKTHHQANPVRPFGPCRSSTSEWTNTSLEVSIGGWKNTHVFFLLLPVLWVFCVWMKVGSKRNTVCFLFCIAILNIMFVLSSW